MTDNLRHSAILRHRQLLAESIYVHAVEGGEAGKPAILFLHGWPQNWCAFERVMASLSKEAHVIALDLPGIGDSQKPPASNNKRTLAMYVRAVIKVLAVRSITLVGHDIGGQIVYAYLHECPGELNAVVIMNVAIPGVDPWVEVKRNPHIWHFAFHAVPDLPERLVDGKQAAYFDVFFRAISSRASLINS